MKIQEYLTCAIQNIQVLIKHTFIPKKNIGIVALARVTGSVRVISLPDGPLMRCYNTISSVADISLKIINGYRVSLGIV
jgi:hypothetical protein